VLFLYTKRLFKISVGHGSRDAQKYINTLKNGLTYAQNDGNIEYKEIKIPKVIKVVVL